MPEAAREAASGILFSGLRTVRGSSYFPVPVSTTDCGEKTPVSATLSLAVSAPVVVGAKAT